MYTYYDEKHGHVVRVYSEQEIDDAIGGGVKYQCSWCGTLYYPEEGKDNNYVCPEKGCGGYMKRLYY